MAKKIKITGIRNDNNCLIFLDGELVQYVNRNRYPTMGWGYNAPEAADTARSILLAIYPVEFTDRYYHDFMETFVITWPDADQIEVEIDLEAWERRLEGFGR